MLGTAAGFHRSGLLLPFLYPGRLDRRRRERIQRFNDLTFQRITRRQPVLGIIGGVLGGAVTHLFAAPAC